MSTREPTRIEALNAGEQDRLFMDLTHAVVVAATKELYARGFKDEVDQATALMDVCCNIIAAQISGMPEENRKYALDKLVHGIIESQIPTLNDKYLNDEDNRD